MDITILKIENSLSLDSKYPILVSLYNDLNKFNSLKPQRENKKVQKESVYDNASELYNKYLGIYLDEYNALPNDKK